MSEATSPAMLPIPSSLSWPLTIRFTTLRVSIVSLPGCSITMTKLAWSRATMLSTGSSALSALRSSSVILPLKTSAFASASFLKADQREHLRSSSDRGSSGITPQRDRTPPFHPAQHTSHSSSMSWYLRLDTFLTGQSAAKHSKEFKERACDLDSRG